MPYRVLLFLKGMKVTILKDSSEQGLFSILNNLMTASVNCQLLMTK